MVRITSYNVCYTKLLRGFAVDLQGEPVDLRIPGQWKQELIRKARISDVVEMKHIINAYSKDELMLARSLSEIYETIRDYYVSYNFV